ncbi:MAG TPA: glycosyltransferase family 4 protein [Flavisolibacter sp.]|nr:glycosyltransferase family 4 protein [Flavisolibacter sp.]
MNKTVHVVCLDAPSPPDYGGAIDMYYKVKSLAAIGVKVILHYYNYNENRNSNGLEGDCTEIDQYERKNILQSFSTKLPYIIRSRINKQLIARLNADDHPIILEGLHCTGLIPYIKNNNRVVIRMHNEEATYYRSLAAAEKNLLKKNYFLLESQLLHKYQLQLKKDVTIAALSYADLETFSSRYHLHKSHIIPCFIPWQSVEIKEGRGSYCLYHGNMSVAENEKAAMWLIENVFSKIEISFIIAGKYISKKIIDRISSYKNITAFTDPPINKINELVDNAHINVLPSMNTTGVKLKLLHSLLRGRFCVTNKQGIDGSGVQNGVILAEHPDEFIQIIKQLSEKEFTQEKMQERQPILAIYNNIQNAEKLSALL